MLLRVREMEVSEVEWDEGNWPKCAKHGVSKEEVEWLLLDSDPVILPDRTGSASEVRYNAVGRTRQGRALFVVFTVREHDGIPYFRPISARYMHAKEIANYERQKAT